MRFYERTKRTDAGDFNEGVNDVIPVPRDRRISELYFCPRITIDNGEAAINTLTRRQLYSIITNMTLQVNGQVGNINVEGSRYYDFVKTLTGREPLVIQDDVPLQETDDISIGASTSSVVEFFVPFYFKKNVMNPYDVSSLLDAFAMSSLEFNYTIGAGWLPAETDLTIDGDNSAATLMLKEMYIDVETLKTVNAAYGNESFYNVFYTQQQDRTLTTSAGLANDIDLMTGYIHQQMMFHTYDGSACDWVNDLITQLRVKQTGSQGDTEFIDLDWEHSQGEDKTTSCINAIANGATMFDCETKLGGLDARALKNGDLKLNYTTGATLQSGTDVLDVLYKSLLPVKL